MIWPHNVTDYGRELSHNLAGEAVFDGPLERLYASINGFEEYLWDTRMIHAVLRNEAYTGVLIQNRYEIQGFGDNRRVVKRKKEDWSVVEGGIPAIIDQESFEKSKINSRPKCGHNNISSNINLFECPYCGRKLSRYAGKYVCLIRNKMVGSSFPEK